jgi:hypothetical protein
MEASKSLVRLLALAAMAEGYVSIPQELVEPANGSQAAGAPLAPAPMPRRH